MTKLNFMNDNIENVHLSSTKPNTWTAANFATLNHFVNDLWGTIDMDIVCHNLINVFRVMSFCMVYAALAFIAILNYAYSWLNFAWSNMGGKWHTYN